MPPTNLDMANTQMMLVDRAANYAAIQEQVRHSRTEFTMASQFTEDQSLLDDIRSTVAAHGVSARKQAREHAAELAVRGVGHPDMEQENVPTNVQEAVAHINGVLTNKGFTTEDERRAAVQSAEFSGAIGKLNEAIDQEVDRGAGRLVGQLQAQRETIEEEISPWAKQIEQIEQQLRQLPATSPSRLVLPGDAIAQKPAFGELQHHESRTDIPIPSFATLPVAYSSEDDTEASRKRSASQLSIDEPIAKRPMTQEAQSQLPASQGGADNAANEHRFSPELDHAARHEQITREGL